MAVIAANTNDEVVFLSARGAFFVPSFPPSITVFGYFYTSSYGVIATWPRGEADTLCAVWPTERRKSRVKDLGGV